MPEGDQAQAQGLAETALTPEIQRDIFHLQAQIYPEPMWVVKGVG